MTSRGGSGVQPVTGCHEVAEVLVARGQARGILEMDLAPVRSPVEVAHPTPVSLTIQWLRNGTRIPEATGQTYTVLAADRGAQLSVAVTGRQPGFITDTEVSASMKVSR